MQILINGLITGLNIVVLALAFVVVYLPTRIFHIALAGVYAAVPFIVWSGLELGWPWSIAILVAILTGVVISLACEWINHAPLESKQAASGAHLVSSLGIYIIIVQIVAMFWGYQSRFLRSGASPVTRVAGIFLTQPQLITATVSIVAIALFYLWLRYSKLGLEFRAMADNPTEFALRGYNLNQLRLVAFALSGLLGTLASLLTAYDVGFEPNSGLIAVLLAVVAVLIGGRQSFWGALLGGILLGVVRSLVVWFFTARWENAATFAILVLFLFLRPNGFLGQKYRLESES